MNDSGATYTGFAHKIQDRPRHILGGARSLCWNLVKQRTENIPFSTDRIHIAWNN
jgi:hypothetical protein